MKFERLAKKNHKSPSDILIDRLTTLFQVYNGIHSPGATQDRQTSILVNQKLHPLALTLVDQFEHGRNRDPVYTELIEQNRDWLWQFLLSLEKKECGSNIKKV